MTVYVVSGTATSSSLFFCIKTSATLALKLVRVDAENGTSTFGYTVYAYTGGGTITGGTSPTPMPLRSNAPPALATVKLNATAISGTQTVLQAFKSVGLSTVDSFTPPGSVILSAASSSVLAVSFATNNTAISFWFDELEIQPGY